MRPIETPTTDTRFVGGPGIDDLPTETLLELNPDDGTLMRANRSRWRPDDNERMAIALGGDVVLDVFGTTLPPVRVLATALPVQSPEKVYAAVDAILARGVGWSLAATLGELGYEVSLDTALGWSDTERAQIASWLADYPEDEGRLAAWAAAKPSPLR